MANINSIKRIFVRQSTGQDCGIACLQMVFKYYGLHMGISAAGCGLTAALSLAEMQCLCAANGVAARPVEMELAYLQTLKKPVILHILDEHSREHYVVFFQAVKQGGEAKFIIADPARNIYLMDEQELAEKWVSRAALYFEHDQIAPVKHPGGWQLLWQFSRLPFALIPAFAVLSLVAAAFGVAVTWLLQRGMYDNRLVQGRIMIAVLLFLVILYLGRGFANYLKQYLLIKVNIRLNETLIHQLIGKLFEPAVERPRPVYNVHNYLLDIQKVQAAASAFIAVLCSDSILIAALLGAIFYFLPVAGLVDLLTFFIAVILIISFVPGHVAGNVKLSHRSRTMEKLLESDYLAMNDLKSAIDSQLTATHTVNFNGTMRLAEKVGDSLSRMMLWLDLLQTINLAIIFFIGFWQYNHNAISYDTAMIAVIMSYLLSAITPKINHALIVMYEGADAAIQLNTILGS